MQPTDKLQPLLEQWNKTERNYPLEQCLHQLVEAQVERTPDAVAVVFENQHLTYRQLNDRANHLAVRLQSLGVGPNVFVGICVERSLEMVVGLLAILKAGGAYVPLDPEYPADRLNFMIADAAAPVLLTQSHLTARLPAHNARVIVLEALKDSSDKNPEYKVTPDDLAYMIYTSGSTGRPKGAMNAHRGIVNRLLWMQDEYRLSASDTVLQKTPFSFDVSVWEFFWPLMTGARLVMARPGGHRDPAYLVELINRERVTVLHFVPSMLALFLDEPRVGSCWSLRDVICSGEALPYELQQRFFARLPARLHNLYGPTEAAVDVTYWECQRNSTSRVVPIGRPVANTQCYILDERLQPVPVGEAGELHLGGIQVGRGYHNRPDLTAEKFIPDPFRKESGARLYKTGDLARYLPDGAIEYLGRMDFQVKIRGLRVELGEVETQLGTHPAVKQVVVVVREDEPGQPRLVAYLVSTGVKPVDVTELRSYLLRLLPEHMVPASFVWLQQFPLSPNGKVDRRALPAPVLGRQAHRSDHAAPQTEMERALAELWKQVLGMDSVGVHDNFFELGGDSLRLVRVHQELRKRAGERVPLVALFQYPTIHSLAAHLNPPPQQPGARIDARQRAARQIAAAGRAVHRVVRADWPITRGGNLDVPLLEPPYESLLRMFGRWVEETPAAIAVAHGHRQWTYAELDAKARAIAGAATAGEAIAVSGDTSLELVAAMLGVLGAGGVLVTIDPRLPVARQQVLVKQAGVKCLLWIGAAEEAPEWMRLSTIPRFVAVDPKHFDALPATPVKWKEVRPNDAAYIFFTSGTTGLPKGVVGCHGGLNHFLSWQSSTFNVRPGDRVAQLTGLSFDVVMRAVFLALVSGGTLCLPPSGISRGEVPVLPWLESEKITLLHAVPSQARMWLADSPEKNGASALRCTFFAGDSLTDSLVRRWRERLPGGQVVNLYGPTETTLAKFYYVVPETLDKGVVPVGWPLPQTEGVLLEGDEIGIRTPFRTRGYLNAPEEQAARFFQNPRRDDSLDLIYRSGDRGRFREDGALEILGRLDHQVKIQGVRVETDEVSAVISHHPSVTACVVVSHQETGRLPSLTAYLVAPDVTEAELRGFLVGQLPVPMVPGHFVFLDRLPLNANGKVNRSALPAPVVSHAVTKPGSATEQLLVEIWRGVLGMEQVGLEENFIELGGDSLRMEQVRAKLLEALKYEVPSIALFQYPTIHSLAGWLNRQMEERLSS